MSKTQAQKIDYLIEQTLICLRAGDTQGALNCFSWINEA